MRYLWAGLILTLAGFLVFFAFFYGVANASTTLGNRPNSLGVLEIYQNPYAYLLALPIDGQILDGKFTNVRFWPYGTPTLYDESFLFCGDVADQFINKPMVIIYEKQAHRMYQGISCHELLSAIPLEVNSNEGKH